MNLAESVNANPYQGYITNCRRAKVLSTPLQEQYNKIYLLSDPQETRTVLAFTGRNSQMSCDREINK